MKKPVRRKRTIRWKQLICQTCSKPYKAARRDSKWCPTCRPLEHRRMIWEIRRGIYAPPKVKPTEEEIHKELEQRYAAFVADWLASKTERLCQVTPMLRMWQTGHTLQAIGDAHGGLTREAVRAALERYTR